MALEPMFLIAMKFSHHKNFQQILLETLFRGSTLLRGIQYISILELLFKEPVNQLILCCWEASQGSISLFSGFHQTIHPKSVGSWSWDKPWLFSLNIPSVALAKSSSVGRSLLLTVMTLTLLYWLPKYDHYAYPIHQLRQMSGIKSLTGFTCFINLEKG